MAAVRQDRLRQFIDVLIESIENPATGGELAGRAFEESGDTTLR